MATSCILATGLAPANRFSEARLTARSRPFVQKGSLVTPRWTSRRDFVKARGLLDKNDELSYEDTNEDFPEPEKDFWEDEKFEALGQVWKYAVPLAALGVGLVGAFASSQYNEGADTYLQAAPGDEVPAFTVEASKVDSKFLTD